MAVILLQVFIVIMFLVFLRFPFIERNLNGVVNEEDNEVLTQSSQVVAVNVKLKF